MTQQTLAMRDRNRFRSAHDAELSQDRLDVTLDGDVRDMEPAGDGLVR
jgi:hypothetical protein